MTTPKNPQPAMQGFNLHKIKKALLLGVYKSGGDKEICEDHLRELHRLCETFGIHDTLTISCPIKKYDAATYLGSGKLEELATLSKEQGIELVIFDDEISPHQQRNVEAIFQLPIIDRTELIIEVFAQ